MKSKLKQDDHYADWAKIWDENAGRIKTAQSVAEAIRAQVELSPQMSGLDFGCGTGLLTMFMQPFLKKITAVDISAEMLKQLRLKIKTQNIANITACRLNWETEPFPGQPFDLVFSSMTLHHVADLNNLFKKFHAALKNGGSFCAADLYEEPGDFHSDHDGVAHFGFVPEILRQKLKNAGFENVRHEKIYTITKIIAGGQRKSYPVFLICAQKFLKSTK